MAAHPIVLIDHGRVEIPEEPQSEPRSRDGARLQLVPRPTTSNSGAALAKAWEDFLGFGGPLAHSDYDPHAELDKEKQRELEEEDRWARS